MGIRVLCLTVEDDEEGENPKIGMEVEINKGIRRGSFGFSENRGLN